MKKKILVMGVLALALCLLVGAALAESWYCTNCGASNSGNFCSNCGTAKPKSTSGSTAATISNIRFSLQSNGDILVKWDDSANQSPYKITYTTADWERTWHEKSEYAGRSATLQYLIPGVTYQITVSNGKGSKTVDYTVPRPIFSEYSTGGKFLKLTQDRFSLSKMASKPTETFQVRVSWPKLKKSRDYAAKLVLKTPSGYSGKLSHWDSFTFENRYAYTYMTYSLQSEWLDQVEKDFGSIPMGTYTFEIYMDGQLYDYASFTLSN